MCALQQGMPFFLLLAASIERPEGASPPVHEGSCFSIRS
jgi:hypothetical protein